MEIQHAPFQRKFVIGDIRGALGNLKRLLDRLQPTINDHLVFLGGNLGPGEDSKGVLDELIALRSKTTCIFLIGCTEFLFGEINPENPNAGRNPVWLEAGGQKILESYVPKEKAPRWFHVDGKKLKIEMQFNIPETHIRFLQSHRLAFEDADIPLAVCHYIGDFLQNGKNVAFYLVDRLLRRELVHGHTPQKQPTIEDGKIGIDLGSGYEGGKLCAFECLSRTFTEVG